MNTTYIPYTGKNRGSPCRPGKRFRNPGNPSGHMFLGMDVNRASIDVAIIGCIDAINVFIKVFSSELKSLGLAYTINNVGLIDEYLISHVKIILPSFNDNEVEKLLSAIFSSAHQRIDIGWLKLLRMGATEFRQFLSRERRLDMKLSVNAMRRAIEFAANMGIHPIIGMEALHSMNKLGAMYDFEMDFDGLLHYIELSLEVNPLNLTQMEAELGGSTNMRWRGSLLEGSLAELILINPARTSGFCSNCMRLGLMSEVRRFGRRNVLCAGCGIILDRDENASISIAIITMTLALHGTRFRRHCRGIIFNGGYCLPSPCIFLGGLTLGPPWWATP